GREATTRTTEIKLPQKEDLAVNLSAPADSVTITIRDSDDKVVRTVKVDGKAGGAVPFTWDGKNDAGEEMAEGSYSISVTASNTDKTPVSAYVQLTGVIESLAFEPTGAVSLKIGAYTVSPGDIESVQR
ncbi:hypothetical protein L6R52_17905, partial [Myxococcota bacterium]|nr:hypothetical protein [Myxococcota bacterium]